MKKFTPFKEAIEADSHEMKIKNNHVLSIATKSAKNLAADISEQVRKRTQHLRAPAAEGMNSNMNLDSLLVEAYKEGGVPDKKVLPGRKPNEKEGVKESLL